jgi:Ran GTPase-activating protein (RanGAP) involved in mRNA processing and transport
MSTVITTLTGLQNLPNLRTLDADYNGLHNTTVDVSGLTNLEDVDLSDNDDIATDNDAALTVNVTGCTSLRELRLDDNNFLENQLGSIIGLTTLTALELLDIDECRLSGTLDLSMFPLLEDLDLNDNGNVTGVIISSEQPINDLNLNDCALQQTAVDNVLVTLASGSVSNGEVSLSGENMAVPGPAGREALAVLSERGWYFSLNTNSIELQLVYEETEGSVCGSSNLGTYYILSGSTITPDNVLYTNAETYTFASDGWYATGSLKFEVSGSGTILSTGSCE